MRIYWIKAQAPRRVLALVRHLGVDADLVHLDAAAGELQAPSYATLNPNMKAPLLVDGEHALWESAAIMAYLCIRQGSDMWPSREPEKQVEVLRWISWNEAHWGPAVAPFYFEYVVKPTFGAGVPDPAVLPPRRPELERYARVLDAHLRDRRHVACGRLTIADFQLASMAAYWQEAKVPLQRFRNVVRWLDGLMDLPAWANPWPR